MPLDLRLLMQECILALFWPKKRIVEFLLSVEAPVGIVPAPDTTMGRYEIVADVFSKLSARPDRGFTAFQTMLDRLSNWTHFDSYYFDTLKKLDRVEAQECIARLKASVLMRNDTTERRRAAAENNQSRRRATADLGALKSAFGKLFGTGMTPQARGYLFETFLKQLFDGHGVVMGEAFNLTGEQIDGTFKFEGENYVVEAKWLDAAASTGDLYKFAHKVDGKMYGRGLFVSVNGFSDPALEAIIHGKHIKTILVDGEDLSAILEDRLTLLEMLDYKVRAAQTRGDVYVCPLRRTSKI